MPTTTPNHTVKSPAELGRINATRELREVFDPLCDAVAEAALPENMPPGIIEAVQQLPVHELQYGTMHTSLVGGGYFHRVTNHPDFPNYSEQEAWKTFAYVDGQSIKEQVNIMFAQKSIRQDRDVWGTFEHLAQAPSFLFCRNSLLPYGTSQNGISEKLVAPPVVPIGQYGKEFALGLLQTTLAMQAVAETQMPVAEEVTQGHERTLNIYTARGADAPITSPSRTMLTEQEGILTIMQAITLLTMEKVEGYDDPTALVRDIVDSGLIERLTRYVPMGFVGPWALNGKYFPDVLEKRDDGSLGFSEAFESLLAESRAKYMAQVALEPPPPKGRRTARSGDHGDRYRHLGTVCPVANTGVKVLAQTFSKLLPTIPTAVSSHA